MARTIWISAVGRVFGTACLDPHALKALHALAAGSDGMVHGGPDGGWWVGAVADTRPAAGEALEIVGAHGGGWLVGEAAAGTGDGACGLAASRLAPPDTATEARARAFCDAMPYALRAHPRLLPFGRWLVSSPCGT